MLLLLLINVQEEKAGSRDCNASSCNNNYEPWNWILLSQACYPRHQYSLVCPEGNFISYFCKKKIFKGTVEGISIIPPPPSILNSCMYDLKLYLQRLYLWNNEALPSRFFNVTLFYVFVCYDVIFHVALMPRMMLYYV